MRTKGLLLLALATMVLLAGCGPNGKMTIQERKATINEMAQNTLNDFFQAQPALRERVSPPRAMGLQQRQRQRHLRHRARRLRLSPTMSRAADDMRRASAAWAWASAPRITAN